MSDLNVVTLSGRLTRDPELRHTPSGAPVCSMGLAFNTSRKQGDEWIEDSHFVDLTAWGKRGEFFARKLRKGSAVTLVGELRYRSWETDGGKRSKLDVWVSDLKSQDLFRKADDDYVPASGGGDFPAPASDDDIPF